MNAYICTPIESAALLAKLLQIGTATPDEAASEEARLLELEQLAPSSRGHSPPLLESRVALARVDGDAGLYRRLLQRFLQAHFDDARSLRRAFAAGDTVDAAQIAHSLAAAAANIGASQLQRAAHDLEDSLTSGGSVPPQWLDDFERTHEVTRTAAAAALNASAAVAPLTVKADVRPSVLLGRARSLIESHDTAAVDCVQLLSASLADQPNLREPLRRLEASIESYNFELAQAELEALTGALGSSQAPENLTTE